MKIEIGDIVEAVVTYYGITIPGRWFKVVHISKHSIVRSGDGVELEVASLDDFKVIKYKATKLAKKLYPNWEEKDGWIYPNDSELFLYDNR